MQGERENPSPRGPLPEGWWSEFARKADFELSFKSLEGSSHFYAEALRGHIRSLELRTEEASEHFQRAYSLSKGAPKDIANSVRQFFLEAYAFENIVLTCQVEPDRSLSGFGVLTLPEEILEDYPEVRTVIQLRKYLEGLLRLHVGDFKEAEVLFKDLLGESQKKGESVLHHIALGASYLNLGQKSLAEEELKVARAELLSGEELLYQARGSALLCGLFTFLGNTQEAARWKSFLEALACPEGTRKAFLKRAERISERSKARGWLLVL